MEMKTLVERDPSGSSDTWSLELSGSGLGFGERDHLFDRPADNYSGLSLTKRMDLLIAAKYDTALLRTRSERWQGSNHLMELDLAGDSPVGSFKYRGAWNAIVSEDSDRLLNYGVITASAGNHGLGVALAVHELNELYERQGLLAKSGKRVRAKIVVPRSAAPVKLEAITNVGGNDVDLVVEGDDYSEAYQQAYSYTQREPGAKLIHPYDDPRTVEGQRTAGYDLVNRLYEQKITPANTVVVAPVGGGGLLAGITQAVLEAYPNPNNRPQIVGAQLEGADSAAQSWRNYRATGELCAVQLPQRSNAFADGTGVDKVGNLGLAALPYVSDFVTITNEQLAKGYADHLDSIYMNLMVVYGRHGIDPFYGLHEPASMIAEVAANIYACNQERGDKTIINLKTGINYSPELVEKIVLFA